MKYIPWAFGSIIIIGILASLFMASGGSLDIINPTGYVANQQKELLYFAIGLSLLVIVPVFGLTIFIAHKYRHGKKSTYTPDNDSTATAEAIWWAIPIILIFILSVVTWFSSYALDPYKAIASSEEPINIQVVSLNYKWLFIYPDYNIATVNYLHLPIDRPVNFVLTSDAPMTSFWIPSLGSQIYAMSGMQTKLHLVSNKEGVVNGKNSNISGEGYADMIFKVKTVSQTDFDTWADGIKRDSQPLSMPDYQKLSVASIEKAPLYYTNIEPSLFNLVIEKYSSHGAH